MNSILGYIKKLLIFVIPLELCLLIPIVSYAKCAVTGGACSINDLIETNNKPVIKNNIKHKETKIKEQNSQKNTPAQNNKNNMHSKFNSSKNKNISK
ncbi:hypothetical protein IJG72_04780 [bacterium]|nr:hypothetical protein [bacterium]